MKKYESIEAVGNAIENLVKEKRPFRFTFHTLASFSVDAIPVKDSSGLIAVCIHPVPGKIFVPGKEIWFDFLQFQDLTWEPIEVNDFDWKKYVELNVG